MTHDNNTREKGETLDYDFSVPFIELYIDVAKPPPIVLASKELSLITLQVFVVSDFYTLVHVE